MGSCESTSVTDVLLRINFKIICSCDKGPQNEESAILTVGVLCNSFYRRCNIRRVELCESTSPTDALLRINLKIICSCDKDPQTEEYAILIDGGLCNSSCRCCKHPEGGVVRKHLPNGYTAQNKFKNNLFIRQWSPDRRNPPS